MEESGRESPIKWGAPFWQLLMALERVSSLHPLAIIARKRLDITFFDFVQAIRFIVQDLLLPGFDREGARQKSSLELSSAWEVASVRRERLRHEMPSVTDTSKASDAVYPTRTSYAPFLSVRTAFDLYLKALRLPRGSLVVCSPLTIPDMVTILCEHGLVPLPIDLDPSTLAPNARALETEVSRRRAKSGDGDSEARVRAIYVAHVFGAQVDIAPIAEVAARCGVLLWEDCAQVFTGLEGDLGHPKSDAVFFSFGVIKRATALGGAVARISDAVIMSDMLREEADYPVQPTMTYLLRVLKCFMLSSCTSPLIYGIIVHSLLLMGVDYDKLVMKLSKGFPKKGLLKAIRKRPSIPLVQMLAWRVTRYTSEGVEIRLRNCNRMFRVLDDALAGRNQFGEEAKESSSSSSSSFARANDVLPGIWAHRHTLWLYPVMIRGRSGRAADYIVDALVDEGFDATRSPTSLMPIDRCVSSRETACSQDAVGPLPSSCVPECSSMMDSLVYLPLSNNIPDSEMDRMMLALARALSDTSFPEVCRDKSEERRGAKRARFRVAGRKIIAFMCRLDVFALSIFCAILFVAMTVVDFVLR